jgi:hypothetical protein
VTRALARERPARLVPSGRGCDCFLLRFPNRSRISSLKICKQAAQAGSFHPNTFCVSLPNPNRVDSRGPQQQGPTVFGSPSSGVRTSISISPQIALLWLSHGAGGFRLDRRRVRAWLKLGAFREIDNCGGKEARVRQQARKGISWLLLESSTSVFLGRKCAMSRPVGGIGPALCS